MKKLFGVYVFLAAFTSLARANPPDPTILLQSSSIVSSEFFAPEPFATLPPESVVGITEEDYEQCVDKLNLLGTQFYQVTYLSDGLRVSGIVGLPKNFDGANRYPVIIYNRGGNREFGRIVACSLFSINNLFGGNGKNIIFAPQYRGVAGGEGVEEFGGRDVNDVLNFLEISRSMNFSDPKNIFLSGWSRGGMMTYLALKAGASVNAAIVGVAWGCRCSSFDY